MIEWMLYRHDSSDSSSHKVHNDENSSLGGRLTFIIISPQCRTNDLFFFFTGGFLIKDPFSNIWPRSGWYVMTDYEDELIILKFICSALWANLSKTFGLLYQSDCEQCGGLQQTSECSVHVLCDLLVMKPWLWNIWNRLVKTAFCVRCC